MALALVRIISHSVGCLLFCLLWGLISPMMIISIKGWQGGVIVSQLHLSRAPLLIRQNLCQAPFLCFELTSPVPSCLLSLTGSVCNQMQDWPGRDPWLNTETEMKDSLVQCMTLHPSWELDLTLLPKACTDNEPMRYYAPSKTFLRVGGSLDNLI